MAALFPQARVLVLSSDLIATVERMREELKEIEEGRVDEAVDVTLSYLAQFAYCWSW